MRAVAAEVGIKVKVFDGKGIRSQGGGKYGKAGEKCACADGSVERGKIT